MGTGSTLALLPAENATGNFVKVVQRLPVRIDLIDYDPDKTPLFIGLSVTPYVHVQRAADRARTPGKVLQPLSGRRRHRRRARAAGDAAMSAAAHRGPLARPRASVPGWSPWPS